MGRKYRAEEADVTQSYKKPFLQDSKTSDDFLQDATPMSPLLRKPQAGLVRLFSKHVVGQEAGDKELSLSRR